MTLTRFEYECSQRLIDPAVAMENQAIMHAIESRDWNGLLELLDTEF